MLAVEKSGLEIYPIYLDTQNELIVHGAQGIVPGTLFNGNVKIATSQSQKEQIKNDYEIGKLYLNDLIQSSGGRIITAAEILNGPKRVAMSIPEELTKRYYLTINTGDSAATGARKALTVRINKPGLAISTRGSYIAKNDQK